MRTLNIITLITLTACADTQPEPPVVNVDIDVIMPEDSIVQTEPADEPEVDETTEPVEEPTTYYVADGSGQVHETDTLLEYVDGYTYSIDTGNVPMDCIVVTLRVPEDAEQGVLIRQIEYGAYGYDSEDSLWMNAVDSGGAGHEMLYWSAFSIFENVDNLWNAYGYMWDDMDPIWYEVAPDWAGQFGCWGDHCATRTIRLQANHYVPPGEINLGFCAHYWSTLAMNEGWGEPSETDSMTAVLGKITWSPADTQDFTSPYVDGVFLPMSSQALTYQSPF